MKSLRSIIIPITILLLVSSCFEDLDDNAVATKTINNFVWRGMNTYYAYKDNIPDLANDRFASDAEYNDYLSGFNTPEALFESLLYQPNSVDEFSRIVSNYNDLEQQIGGTSLSNGMAFGLVAVPNSDTAIFGYVRYVMPNTSAQSQNVQRGMIFNAIDGINLTRSNYINLLFGTNTTYTINLATYSDNGTPTDTSDDTITPTTQSITLTKTAYTENPILTTETFTIGTKKIGYLMYNGFRSDNANLSQLNSVFANFQSQNITDLVLDLRYNGGGSVDTSLWLASLINGQLNGQIFFTENWNNDIQAQLQAQDPELLINRFTNQMLKTDSNGNTTFQENLNSLNLTKLYVLTSFSTASASELLINGLTPHIDVIKIGRSTRGKPQASFILYDSPNFNKQDANPNHYYAMLPLVYESANSDGFSQYYDGLTPTTGLNLRENYANLGTLGQQDEPLLALAIQQITGTGRFFNTETSEGLKEVSDNNKNNILNQLMIDTNPILY